MNNLQALRALLPALTVFTLACGDDPSTSTSANEADTDASTESADTSSSETGDGPETGDGDGDDTETGDGDGDGEGEVCENELGLGAWLLMVNSGDFPNDVPEDLQEDCTIVETAADELGVSCPSVDFSIKLEVMPLPDLPGADQAAEVKIHHEPGWLNWPDLWISVDVVGGDLFAFQTGSVLQPTQGPYVVPFDPTVTGEACGPFSFDGPFPDSCGEQVGHELQFEVDGQELAGWHGAHMNELIGEREFEVWINGAREYIAPPEFCDTSPTWYSTIVRRQGA